MVIMNENIETDNEYITRIRFWDLEDLHAAISCQCSVCVSKLRKGDLSTDYFVRPYVPPLAIVSTLSAYRSSEHVCEYTHVPVAAYI